MLESEEIVVLIFAIMVLTTISMAVVNAVHESSARRGKECRPGVKTLIDEAVSGEEGVYPSAKNWSIYYDMGTKRYPLTSDEKLYLEERIRTRHEEHEAALEEHEKEAMHAAERELFEYNMKKEKVEK